MNDSSVDHPKDPQLSIAAVMHLLSSASMRGASAVRCRVLLQHLERLAEDRTIAEPLRHTCASLYRTWSEVLDAFRQDGEWAPEHETPEHVAIPPGEPYLH